MVLRAEPQAVGPRHKHRLSRADRKARRRAQQSRKRRRLVGGAVGLLLVVAVVAAFVGFKMWHPSSQPDAPADFRGQIEAAIDSGERARSLYAGPEGRFVRVLLEDAAGRNRLLSVEAGEDRTVPSSAPSTPA